MTNKTHFKKVFKSPYLSSSDIDGMTNLTILRVTQEIDRTKRTKEIFNTAYFVEKTLPDGLPLKPMILNVTNSKMVVSFTQSKYIEDWVNVPVSVYVLENVRIGRDVTEGLRISPNQPQAHKEPLTETSEKFNKAVEVYAKTKTFDRIEQTMSVSDNVKEKIVNLAAIVHLEGQNNNG